MENTGSDTPQSGELPISILLVEDDRSDYLIASDLLSHIPDFNYSLDWAKDFERGLDCVAQKRYDLCLVDSCLEGRDGIDFIRQATLRGVEAPVIMLSSKRDESHDVAALRAGAADYLLKNNMKPSFLERSIRYALERQRSQAETMEFEKQLMSAQKMKSLGQLAGSIAHGLNNALGAVVGHLGLIEQAVQERPDLLRSVELAQNGAEQASSLIEHILEYTNPNTSETKAVNLQQIVIEVVDMLTRIIRKNITVTTSFDRSASLTVKGNPAGIRQAITNIALNADEAMPSGGTLHFQFAIHYLDHQHPLPPGRGPGRYIALEIKDSGKGINRQHLDKIFDPTFTTKSQGQGLGLGLAAVYAIMQNHNGWADVQSELMEGTTVTLFFPLSEEKVTSAPATSTAPKEARGVVMVVEDEAVLAELNKLYLEAAGFDVRVFTSSPAAVAWYQNHSEEVDLVLLDMVMPEMDGRTCFESLRRINPDAKVAICAGFMDDDARTLLKNGALKFFQKPGNYPTIITWIAEVLEN